MKSIDWKDVLIRAGKTFLQTALSYLITNLAGVDFFDGDTTKTVLIGLVLSAGAWGVSAAWNGVIAPLIQHKPPDVDEGVKE